MPRTLPISEVKARLPELVTGVQDREEEIVVTRNGRAAAVGKGLSFEEVFGEPLIARKPRGRGGFERLFGL